MRAALCAVAAVILPFPSLGQRKPFSPADLWLWSRITEARISPDGKQVIYVQTREDASTGRTFSNLWIASTDGRQRGAITDGAWRDSSPRWSAEGDRIAYISDRAGSRQIFIRSAGSSEERAMATSDRPPLALAWAPDGRSIVFTAAIDDEAPSAFASWAPREILPLLDHPARKHIQLFILPVAGGGRRQLTKGAMNWLGQPAWLATGESIICEGAPDPDPARPPKGGQIFSIRPSDGGITQLTHHAGGATQPTPSPDGSRIAWIATGPAQPGAQPESYWPRRLFVMNPDGSRVKELAGALDRDIREPQWSSDSRTIYFLADDNGSSRLYAARNDGSARPVTKGRERLRGFSLADNGRAALIRSSAAEAGDLISFADDLPAGVATLAAPNEHPLAERQIGGVEEMHYDSEGHSIQAWLVKPPDFDLSKKYPLLLDIQDTPRAMYGYEFQLRAQIFAAAGYVVLLANPRGTPGYGEQFGNLLRTRYPGDDAEDLMRGVDCAIAKGYIDSRRVMVSGGLVAAWLIGHTDRFAAAVLRRPIADWLTDVVFALDGLRRATSWMGALPWDDPEQYVKHSPIYFAGNFKAPSLVIGPEDDPECRELYFALRVRRLDSAWLKSPPHPSTSRKIAELKAEIAWLQSHFTQNGPGK
jgi:acylaminoacyl-peptidase